METTALPPLTIRSRTTRGELDPAVPVETRSGETIAATSWSADERPTGRWIWLHGETTDPEIQAEFWIVGQHVLPPLVQAIADLVWGAVMTHVLPYPRRVVWTQRVRPTPHPIPADRLPAPHPRRSS